MIVLDVDWQSDRLKRWLLFAAVLGGVLLTMWFFSQRSVEVFGLQLRVHAAPALRGATRLDVPPLGELTAQTHLAPVSIKLSLRQIDFAVLAQLVEGAADFSDMVPGLQRNIVREMFTYVLSLMFIAGVSSALLALTLNLRTVQFVAIAFAAGFVAIALISAFTYATFDVEAFNRPRFDGMIAAYPHLWEEVQGGIQRLEQLRGQMRALGTGVMEIYGEQALPQLGWEETDFSFLVVSDIHNNVAALDFVGGLVSTYPVRAIIDAGDLTDWGTPLEAQLAGQIEQLNVPYMFVAGNHESPQMIERLKQTEHVSVLDGWKSLSGVRILGLPDPSSIRASPSTASPEEMEDLQKSYTEAIQVQQKDEEELWIVVGHEPRAVEHFTENPDVDIVIAGHIHQMMVEQDQHSVYLNPGTTGAAGVRGLEAGAETVIPYTAMLLHFTTLQQGVHLRGVDSVSINPQRGALTVQRELTYPVEEPSPRR